MRGAIRCPPLIDLARSFQSARPMRGAIWQYFQRGIRGGVSIRAPHEGRDETP